MAFSSEVKRLKYVNDILHQQNESLLQENSSKNTIENQECLKKPVCNQIAVTVLDETFKTVPKGPLKQENKMKTFRIKCNKHFEIFSTTDNDGDDHKIKSGKSENTITENYLTNDDVSNRKKVQKSCITNRKYKNNALTKTNDTQTNHNRR